MKKILVTFLAIVIACTCLVFTGCTKGHTLYRGDKSFISNVSIRYPYLDDSRAILSAEDQSTFISYLEKTKLVKVAKTAVFDARPVADNYFAYVNVYGNANEAISVGFYVFEDGKVQVNGLVFENWYDGQLNDKSMDIILKYQGNNFNPAENLKYYSNGTAKKIVDSGSLAESRTYFTSDSPEEGTDILSKFLDGLADFSPNLMPKQQSIDDLGQILPTATAIETYAITFNFNTTINRHDYKSYYLCGIVASSDMVRIIVEQKIKTKTKYILTDYEMDGSAIKDSIKALAIAK